MSAPSGTIRAVSSQEFAQKIVAAVNVAMKALEGVIYPVAALGLIISILIMLVGSAFHSKNLRMIGTVGLASVCGGLLLYLAYPLILGVLEAMGQVLR